MIDFEPSEEQQLIVETVRQFAANEIRPRAREADEAGEIPDEVLQQSHELGLVANALPEEHGGGGARSAVTSVLVAEELACADLAQALAILSPALGAVAGWPGPRRGRERTAGEGVGSWRHRDRGGPLLTGDGDRRLSPRRPKTDPYSGTTVISSGSAQRTASGV